MLLKEKGFHLTLAAHQHLLQHYLDGQQTEVFRLDLAGEFIGADEKKVFNEWLNSPLLRSAEKKAGHPLLIHHGFVHGSTKNKLFQESHLFCFPTHYPAESFGLVVLEAMAWGLPIITTKWHALPEILGAEHPYFLEKEDPTHLAKLILLASRQKADPTPRQRFLELYTVKQYVMNLERFLFRAFPV